ncbi:hypothetical protein HZP23_16470 [Elizabethkingia anophelis]|nr:hypothetical protein [Elizabethkingia anophelis]MCT4298887.1 hypothetical protein [Elizabethkingia anophelis]MCT4302436.1 hypothetical protein [Elizabethkingia anophelis]
MIKLDRHTNPEFSVINISSVILSEINTFYLIKYDALLNKVINTLGESARYNFPYALNFLYLLGKLKYEQDTDSFKANETK